MRISDDAAGRYVDETLRLINGFNYSDKNWGMPSKLAAWIQSIKPNLKTRISLKNTNTALSYIII
jgi:hypothetical protein